MKIKYLLAGILLLLLTTARAQGTSLVKYNQMLLKKIRKAALVIPGERPNQLRYIKFAESPRTFAQTIDGGKGSPYIQARTAYQVMFGNSWVMVDAGMDIAVHRFFGNGKSEPYSVSANDSIQVALKGASAIFITHEHGDHVTGVLRSSNYQSIAPKTFLTMQMVQSLLHKPQMPEIGMKESQLSDFNVFDFRDILPVAPGMVLIKAPGHTKGEIMVYLQLKNGREYMLTGDVSWSYQGIAEIKQKPAAQIKRVGEDAASIQFQLEWLNSLQKQGIQPIVSHDNIVQPDLVKKGLLYYGLLLR